MYLQFQSNEAARRGSCPETLARRELRERAQSDDFAGRGMSHSYRRPERRQTLLILIIGPKCRPITKISVRPRCRVKCNGPSSPASGLFGLPSHCPTLSAPACSYSDSFSVNSSSSSQISISYVASSSSRSLAKAYVPHLSPHATHQHTYFELPISRAMARPNSQCSTCLGSVPSIW